MNLSKEAIEIGTDIDESVPLSPYAERVKALDKSERTQVLLSIKNYTESEEFEEIKAFCLSKYTELRESIIPALRKRKECKATKSLLDTFLVQMDAFEVIYEKVTNEYIKEYIKEEKIEAIKRIIEIRRSTMDNVIDMPFGTDLDMIKAEKEVYNSFEILVAGAYGLYDAERTLRKETVDFQPYE